MSYLCKYMSNQVEQFLQEGKNMLDSGKVDDYDRWRKAILFFIEQQGTPTMIKEIEKEVNRKALWIAYPSQPEGELEGMFYTHKIGQIKEISSVLQALKPFLGNDKKQNKAKPQRDAKRAFSESVKNHVWDRQQGKCAKCENQLNRVATEYDHKVAWENGGLSMEENCQAFCANCHRIKTNEDRLTKQRTITLSN